MTTSSVPVFIKDQYRIVAISTDDEHDHSQIVGYALLNSAGVRLRHALTLDDAKAWMERFIDEDNPAHPALPAQPKRRRARR